MSVDFFDFYWEYHGHAPEHLDAAHAALLASKGGAEEEPGFIYKQRFSEMILATSHDGCGHRITPLSKAPRESPSKTFPP